MTYHQTADLPRHIRDQLPEPAQELYLAIYNRVWEKLNAAAKGETDERALAEQADEAAWLRVREEYAQDEQGRWRPDSVDDDIDKDDIRDTA